MGSRRFAGGAREDENHAGLAVKESGRATGATRASSGKTILQPL